MRTGEDITRAAASSCESRLLFQVITDNGCKRELKEGRESIALKEMKREDERIKILLKESGFCCKEFLLDRVGPEKQKSQEREDQQYVKKTSPAKNQ